MSERQAETSEGRGARREDEEDPGPRRVTVPGPRSTRPAALGDRVCGAGVTAVPGLFLEWVGMLSHGSVTAPHLSPALRWLKQKRKRMRLAGRPVSGAAPAASSGTVGHPQVSALPALLLLLLLRPPVTPGITCPTPTTVEHADIRVKSYNLSSKERYVCNSGFKRKAGTSSLTECVLNTTTNLAHWTTPNLKCIRDPSLTHERPPSTLAPSGVTSEPQSPTPSGKEPAFTSKSDTTVATKPAIIPGSRLMPSKPPSAGTTGVVSHEPSQAPSQTTALEHTPSVASQETPGAYQYNSRVVTVAVSIPVTLLFGVCVVLLLVYYKVLRRPLAPLSKPVHYLLYRRTSRRANVEMENMEDIPMAGGTSGREEDTENYPHDLGSSG
ncbi:PREDICTED: interleukin-15 receptor subunit alpha [Ceratotherium simum simum]|uniref:Interleukin-15 receptor subunit alpha n=1 Tax=Ceratotherium simum simum TaxID=73337 RepID=A0ABM1CHI5_CERSS|nr:PREDICTED: interleukin-15 receptor subunit alpha [Ceratotherium simum simum]